MVLINTQIGSFHVGRKKFRSINFSIPVVDDSDSILKAMNSNELLDILTNRPQDLLIPNELLKTQSLEAVKLRFDPIAKKNSIFEELHVEGLDAEQVWTQAEMVVDGVVESIMTEVPFLSGSGSLKRTSSDLSDSEDDSEESEGFESALENEAPEGFEALESDEENTEAKFDSDEDIDMDEMDIERDDYEGSEGDLSAEGEEEEEGDEDDNAQEEDEEIEDNGDEAKDKFGLNKGLFSLEKFQKQILAMEDQEDEEADNDNIDYFADPDEQDSEFDEDVGDDMKYSDFFSDVKKGKGTKAKQPKRTKKKEPEFQGFDLEPENEEYEDAMKSVRKDLFADDDEEEEDSKENLSTFEKQQREIMKQIEQLENENIAHKTWQVKGEAKAKERPVNSLLEADLDFERSAKPVPVITQETTENLEDIIRRRIKANDFDEIPRRVPDSLPEFRPSKLADVQETKSQKSLAELYEEDHLKKTDPDAYASAETEKQQESHKEIKDLWSILSRKLDTLSSWTYTPKAPKPTISIVANTAAIAMEDAQPTAMATESTLAPQEVYQPQATSKREVVGHSGLPVAKSEMSREERKRERRKHKAKKAKILKEREETQKVKAQKEGSKAQIMENLKKGNVTIIDKKGEKRDMSGKLKKDHAALGGGKLKL